MSKLSRFTRFAALATIGLLLASPVYAQRIRIPDAQFPYSPPPTSTLPQYGPTPIIQSPTLIPGNPSVITPPQMQLPPIVAPSTTFPGTGFDAYGGVGPSQATTWPPATAGSGAMIYPPANSYPWLGTEGSINASPPPVFPPANASPNVYGPAFGTPGNPYLGEAPASGAWPNNSAAWPNQAWSRLSNEWLPRLIEHPRVRHTYLYGDVGKNGDDLAINDIELATTLTFPGCCLGRQPLRVSPGFIFSLWDGPNTAFTGADLPAEAYSAFLAFDYITALNQPMGAELNFTVGVYSDFNHLTTDSLRFTGVALGFVRLSNTTTFKFGAEYLDRLDIKLLPAFGFFMMPNADLKLDLFFPRPKIAHRIPNSVNLEAWAYIGGEYGGGSWTIERIGGMGDQVDINDIRVVIGTEWLGRRGVTGFVELGYVFNRELVYRSMMPADVSISDTFMVRSGLAF